MLTSALTRGTAIIGLLLIVATVISAQGPATQPPPAGIPELLAEVRALRAEVKQAAGTSMRMQLLLARLTLQEQRITSLGREVVEVQGKLVTASRERTATQTELRRMQDALGEGAFSAGEERRQLEIIVKILSERLSQESAHEQHLRAQESELLVGIAAEQARWTDFNTRLDELERALPAASR